MQTRHVRAAVAAAALATLAALPVRASWVQLGLPDLSGSFSPYAISHLADGRYVYAEGGDFILQNAFGAAAYTTFAGVPGGIDPSFIAIYDQTLAVAGAGGFGSSPQYRFNPSDTAAPAFTDIGATNNNYQGVFRDNAGLFVGGTYTGFTHGVRYVSLDGTVSQMVVTNVSTYSAGMARDAAGNLYIGDTDDGKVYRFAASQLTAAIGGTPLAVEDATLVHDFGDGGHIGTLAVDAQGRVWAAGYLRNGLVAYDPLLGVEQVFLPGLDNANYAVASFMAGGVSYVAYVNQANPFTGGTAMTYGFAAADTLVVPEPATAGLLAVGLLALAWRRNRSNVAG